MALHTALLRLSTEGDGDIVDITGAVKEVAREARADNGLITVFVTGSTAGITTMEYEPGGVEDLGAALERLLPRAGEYAHNRLNDDSNAHAHLRASVVGPSESIPIVEGRIALGTWQQIVLIDFDNRPRDRAVTVQIVS